MFHDCTCGRSIPLTWKRCGECDVGRQALYAIHTIEGSERRKRRFQIAFGLAKIRGANRVTAPVVQTTGSTTKRQEPPVFVPLSPEHEELQQILNMIQVRRQVALRRRLTAENVRPSIERWFEQEE